MLRRNLYISEGSIIKYFDNRQTILRYPLIILIIYSYKYSNKDFILQWFMFLFRISDTCKFPFEWHRYRRKLRVRGHTDDLSFYEYERAIFFRVLLIPRIFIGIHMKICNVIFFFCFLAIHIATSFKCAHKRNFRKTTTPPYTVLSPSNVDLFA